VVLVDIGRDGLRGEPSFLPVDATPIYEVQLQTPLADELEKLRAEHPDAGRHLVRIQFTYTAGQDNLEQTLRDLEALFPNWYYREWNEASALSGTLTLGGANPAKSFEETVRDYLRQELMNHPDADCDAVLNRAEALMHEVHE